MHAATCGVSAKGKKVAVGKAGQKNELSCAHTVSATNGYTTDVY